MPSFFFPVYTHYKAIYLSVLPHLHCYSQTLLLFSKHSSPDIKIPYQKIPLYNLQDGQYNCSHCKSSPQSLSSHINRWTTAHTKVFALHNHLYLSLSTQLFTLTKSLLRLLTSYFTFSHARQQIKKKRMKRGVHYDQRISVTLVAQLQRSNTRRTRWRSKYVQTFL